MSLPEIQRDTYFMLDVTLPQALDGVSQYQNAITLSGLEFYDTDGNLIPVEYVVGSTGNYSGYGSVNLFDSDDTTYWYEQYSFSGYVIAKATGPHTLGSYKFRTSPTDVFNKGHRNPANWKVYTALSETIINTRDSYLWQRFDYRIGERSYGSSAETWYTFTPIQFPTDFIVTNVTYPTVNTVQFGTYVYRTVTIGTQTWLAEDFDISMPGCVWENNDEATARSLYHGPQYSVFMTTELSIPGWHIPTKSEMTELVTTVGGVASPDMSGMYLYGGGALKSTTGWPTGTSGGESYDANGTDAYGFSLLFESGTGAHKNAIMYGSYASAGVFQFMEQPFTIQSGSTIVEGTPDDILVSGLGTGTARLRLIKDAT